MRSPQKCLCLHPAQRRPCHTPSKWSAAASTNAGSSVNIPASKFRPFSLFIPMPAPVRFADPIYAAAQSKTISLKCTREQSLRSNFVHSPGNRSKSSLKFSPGSLACSNRTSTPRPPSQSKGHVSRPRNVTAPHYNAPYLQYISA